MQDVLHRCADEEILLAQPQLLAVLGAVLGVQHAGDVLGMVLFLHGAHVVAAVEGLEVDGLAGPRGPQPHGGHAGQAVARHAVVVGGGDHLLGVPPVHHVVLVRDQLAAEAHRVAQLGPHEFPRVAVHQPVVRLLDLAAVGDALLEHAVLVADAVAHAGQADGGDGIHEARRQPPQAAVAQRRVGLDLDQRVEVGAQLRAGLLHGVVEVGGEQGVHQRAAREVFHREVIDALGVVLARLLEGLAPALDDTVAHGMEDGEHPVALGGGFQVLAHGIGQPLDDRVAQRLHRVGGRFGVGEVHGVHVGRASREIAIFMPDREPGASASETGRRSGRPPRPSRSAGAWRSAACAPSRRAGHAARRPCAGHGAAPAC